MWTSRTCLIHYEWRSIYCHQVLTKVTFSGFNHHPDTDYPIEFYCHAKWCKYMYTNSDELIFQLILEWHEFINSNVVFTINEYSLGSISHQDRVKRCDINCFCLSRADEPSVKLPSDDWDGFIRARCGWWMIVCREMLRSDNAALNWPFEGIMSDILFHVLSDLL